MHCVERTEWVAQGQGKCARVYLRTALQDTAYRTGCVALFGGEPRDDMDSAGVRWVDARQPPSVGVMARMCEARGFVSRSYLDGLTLGEFVFHSAGGREGVIDTAMKTSETGYMQRRMIKTLEDVVVSPVGGLLLMGPRVISFSFGDDGLDSKEGVRVPGVGGGQMMVFADPEPYVQQLNGQVEYESWLVRNGVRFPRPIPSGGDRWPRMTDEYVDRPPSPGPSIQELASLVAKVMEEPYDPADSPMYNPVDGGGGASPAYNPATSPAYYPATLSPAYDPTLSPAYDPQGPQWWGEQDAYSPAHPSLGAGLENEGGGYNPLPDIAPDALERLRDAVRAYQH
jgi:hypothetical protein